MPQLDFANYPFISQLFWLLLSFFVLYIYSAKIILPRISKTIEMRDRTIKSAIDDAEKAREQLELNNQSNDVLLSKTRQEAREFLNETQQEIDRKAEIEQNKTDALITEKLNKSKLNIARLKEETQQDVQNLSNEIYKNLVKNYL